MIEAISATELKRKMERQALKTMGENKMSYVVKGKPGLQSYIEA